MGHWRDSSCCQGDRDCPGLVSRAVGQVGPVSSRWAGRPRSVRFLTGIFDAVWDTSPWLGALRSRQGLFVRRGTEILSPSAQGVPVDDEPLTSAIILDGLTGKPAQQAWFLLLRTVGITYPRQNRGVARRATKVETCS